MEKVEIPVSDSKDKNNDNVLFYLCKECGKSEPIGYSGSLDIVTEYLKLQSSHCQDCGFVRQYDGECYRCKLRAEQDVLNKSVAEMTSTRNVYVSWILSIVGIIILGTVLLVQDLALLDKKWPQTPGKVIKSYVKNTTHSGRSRSWVSSNPRIFYQYTVNNKTYEGQSIYMIEPVWNFKKAKKLCKKYPVSSPIKVFYDPQNPKISYLLTRKFDWADKASFSKIKIIILILALLLLFFLVDAAFCYQKKLEKRMLL